MGAPNYCPNCGHNIQQYKADTEPEHEEKQETEAEDIDLSAEQLKAMIEVADMDREFIEKMNDELRRNILLDVKDIVEGKDTERRFF